MNGFHLLLRHEESYGYVRQAISGRCNTQYVQDGAALFATKEGENKPQPNGQDEGWFICVELGCAEAAAFGVLQQKQTHYTRQLYHPRTSYKSCSNQEHLRSSAS